MTKSIMKLDWLKAGIIAKAGIIQFAEIISKKR
jgi:hypothetical protein